MKEKKKIGIFKYLKVYRWKIFFYVLCIALFNASNIFTTLKLADFITLVSSAEYDIALQTGALIVVVGLVGRILYFISCRLYFVVKCDMAYDIQLDLTKQFFKIKTQTFGSVKSGDFINRVCYDPENALEMLDGVIDDFAHMMSFCITTIYILFLNVYVGLIVVAFMAVLFVLEKTKVKLRNKHTQLRKTEKDKMLGLVNEIVKSERDIKSLNLDANLTVEAEIACGSYKKITKKRDMTSSFFWNFRQFLVIIMVAVICLVSIFLMRDGRLALASFLYILMNRTSISEVVWIMGNIASNFSEAKICINRMFQILDEDKYPVEKFGKKYLTDCKGEIAFKNVVFSYSDEKENEETKVLDDLSFEIKPNTTVAFVGKSGSGKTTILNLISKLNECKEGQVLFDGEDVKTLSKKFLRENISLVNQFPYIFDNTIKNNLLMVKPNATDEEIIQACKEASIWEFIESQPEGLNTNVGESGIKLSGGQNSVLLLLEHFLEKQKLFCLTKVHLH